jgi:hypothetical protein
MKIFLITANVIIILLLASVLLWSVFLFWGAYSQHRISIILSENVLEEIRTNIVNQTSGINTNEIIPKTKEAIEKLQSAQKELFDTNTISFIFQFLTLLLVTIGGGVIGLMYNAFTKKQVEAAGLQKQHLRTKKHMARFIKGRNNTLILAVKSAWLHTLGQLYLLSQGNQREALRIMMIDYQSDILRQLEDDLKENDGFEERLFDDIILDAAMKTNLDLKVIKEQVQGVEHDAIERVLQISSQSLDILRDNGRKFVERYKTQWREFESPQDV